MKKNITINLHIGEILVTGRTHNKKDIANEIVAELNRVLSTAFEITKDNTDTQRINPAKAARIEKHYNEMHKWAMKYPFCSASILPKHPQNSNHELANCKFLIEYAQRLILELSRSYQHPNAISPQRRQNLCRAALRFQLDTESLLDLDSLEKDVRHVDVVGCSNPFEKQYTRLADNF